MQSNAFPLIQTEADYTQQLAVLKAYFTGYWLTDFANFSAFTFQSVPRLNWVGFYLYDGTSLRLGPFVGKPACTEIKIGRGVCGAAFLQRKPLLVPDVSAFPGHITCDTDSRSELVIPLMVHGSPVGVLDIDSPELNRFSNEERAGISLWLEAILGQLSSEKLAALPWK